MTKAAVEQTSGAPSLWTHILSRLLEWVALPLVGASGGVAALTGAAVRFIFQPPVIAVDEKTGERHLLGRHLATLREFVRNPTARFFSLTWIALNGIVPLLPMFIGNSDFQVAWQAHIGGFLAGLLLVPLFERRQA